MTLTILPAVELKYISIELTNYCNLNCKICWSQNPRLYPPRPKGYISDKLYHKILNELEGQHDLKVALSYAGESLLHPKFLEYLEAIKKLDVGIVQLATNGVRLSTKICQSLLDDNVDVAVSIHNSPYLKKVISNSYKLHRMKRSTGAKTPIRWNILADEFTQQQQDWLERRSLGACDRIKYVPTISEDLQWTKPKSPIYPLCPSHYNYLAVLWNGDTLPCCHLLSFPLGYSLGDANEKSLKDIFEGASFSALRFGETEGSPCQECQIRY